MQKSYPYYLASQPCFSQKTLPVFDKYTNSQFAEVSLADKDVIDQAIDAAVKAAEQCRKMAPYERQEILYYCIKKIQEKKELLAEILTIEAGKPIKDSRGEVNRLIDTFKIAAEESVRISGEVLNLEISPRAKGYRGFTQRVPIGPCSFISPFNFPLNLVAHKIAPAIATGCPFILKPASRTPIGALMIGEILAETNLPQGAFSILPCNRQDGEIFATDPRLKLLSFTGSPEVGWELKNKAGKKKVILELGGNAACIIDIDTDLTDALQRVIFGAFYQSGQSCVSVQRIIIHQDIYEKFKLMLVEAAKKLIHGNPKLEETFIGPLIAESEAIRLEKWINEAVQNGAKLLCGNERNGSILSATLLENVDKNEKIYAQEAFGPVAILESFNDFSQALKVVNDSRYGLQAGIFTKDIYKIQEAWNTLVVGGVIIGEVPSWRVDNMPYGGVKDSGIGREGVRNTMEELTEIRLLAIRTP